ncbi:MAG: TetR/AcrR family transcriptional regulator [Candidatus Latescibacteria bacterium]|nr:TetR/AcrR family transcriptional regulator [Candidatus Latescibacterota bacterium]
MPTKRFENLDPDKRKEILHAAQAEFLKNGYKDASLNTIIEEARISKGSLYYYFEDKTDLYLTVLGHVMIQLQKKIGGIGAGVYTENFWGDIEDYTRKSLRMIKENPDFVRLARGLFSLISSGNVPDAVADVINNWKGMMTSIVVRGQNIGEIRTDLPLGLLVNILWSLGETMDFWVLSHLDEFTVDELEQQAKVYVNLWKRIAGTKTITDNKD